MPLGDLAAGSTADRAAGKESRSPLQTTIAGEVLKEIRGRVGFLLNVGLHYLTLDRTAPTLSGGEVAAHPPGRPDRLRPGRRALHPRRAEHRPAPARQRPPACAACEQLRDMGNTVLVVEHDEDTMRAADYIVDFGPGPGVRGGEVVAAGSYAEIVAKQATA